MTTTTKRHIASWVLLAVFLPMLILSALHLHERSAASSASCSECVQHHCSGHLGQQAQSVHDCVLCQFLTLPTLAVAVATLTVYNNVSKIHFAQRRSTVLPVTCGVIALRAPPAV